jgi:acetyl-CoA carboxylase alpha subunit
LLEELATLQALSPEALQQQRYDKFRRMGRILEAGQVQESAA